MCADRMRDPDVVIVGSGIAGSLVAKALATAGKKVLILEAGEAMPPDVNAYMDRFLNATAKVPESPYPPALFGPKDLTDPASVNAGRPTVLSLGAKGKFGDWQDPKQSYMISEGPTCVREHLRTHQWRHRAALARYQPAFRAQRLRDEDTLRSLRRLANQV